VRFTVGKAKSDVAIYRAADTCQAEAVSNALQAAGIPYHRRAEEFLGFYAHPTGLPGEGLSEIFLVPEDAIPAARHVLASLPFPPPAGQPVIEAPAAPPSGALHRPLAWGWVIGTLVLVAAGLIAWLFIGGRNS